MKKIIRLCIAFAAAFILFPSCVKKQENVVIEFWTHEDANRQKLEDRYISEFTENHPNVTVNVTRQSSSKLIELLQTAFAAGKGPTMFNTIINEEYPYIAAGRVAPVNYKAAGYKNADAVTAAYADHMLDPVTVNGQVYGLPLELTNWCVYLNKKIFREAGFDPEKDAPKTWEDVMSISQKLALRDGDILKRRGFDFRYGYYLETLVPLAEQLGGQLISDDGKEAIVGKDAWIAVLSYLKQWGPKGLNLGSPTYKNAHSLFNADNNDVTMCLSGLYQEARIRNQNPNFYDSGDWMIIPYPKFQNAVKDVAACYYGHYYMVNADATKAEQEASWQLIAYMLGHGEEYLSEVNIVQPTLALLNSKTFKDMPYSEVFANDLNRAHIVYYGAASASIQSALKTALQNVMLGDASPETVYEQLKKTVQDLIDEQK